MLPLDLRLCCLPDPLGRTPGAHFQKQTSTVSSSHTSFLFLLRSSEEITLLLTVYGAVERSTAIQNFQLMLIFRSIELGVPVVLRYE
jgi:hypothetical protein